MDNYKIFEKLFKTKISEKSERHDMGTNKEQRIEFQLEKKEEK